MSCSESNTNVDETVNLPQVVIGNQIWMKENLNASGYRNGDPIRYAGNNEEWKITQQKALGAWCYYDFDPKNGEIYGKLYNWIAVNDPRGLAPKGYHIASHSEWFILTDFLGGVGKAFDKMNSKTGWKRFGKKSDNGTNSSGFNGLPGGYRYHDGTFTSIGVYGIWWSSTEYNTYWAWGRGLGYGNGEVYSGNESQEEGLSVRCLRD